MSEINRLEKRTALSGKSHMPSDSVFFEKIVPILLAFLGLVMLVLVLFAAGVLIGLVRF